VVPSFPELAARLAGVGRHAHTRGWALGTSGNFSAVVGTDPLRLAITASGLDKGRLLPEQILEVDGNGELVRGNHPAVKANPDFFEDIENFDRPAVEAATAAPGEKRGEE